VSPKQIHELLLAEVRELVAILAGGYPVAQLGVELENFSNYFQGLAITHLLTDANLEQFKLYLTRSGYARRYFLSRSARDGHTNDPRLGLSRTEAFLDSLAAGQLALAREIASLSGDVWRSDWEYEDDFCYFLFLHRIAGGLDEATEASLSEIVEQFEKALEGGKSPRLDVCNAILARDSNAFTTGIVALMEQRREELFQLRERLEQLEPQGCVCWARSFVSIEGLALMRLAELNGLPPLDPDVELPLCPVQGRIAAVDTDYEDFFQGMELRLAKR
jgi:hypothetical protein